MKDKKKKKKVLSAQELEANYKKFIVGKKVVKIKKEDFENVIKKIVRQPDSK